VGDWRKGHCAIHKQSNFTAQCHHRVIFRDQKSRTAKKRLPSEVFVWRKFRMLGGDILQDMPKHVLITSYAVTKSGTGHVFRFANRHYKNISKDGSLGKIAGGRRTTTALVRWTASPISGAECDSLIDFSAQLCAHIVELSDPKQISLPTLVALNRQIAEGVRLRQWLLAVATIRQ
jgi:hypothetical protein